MKYLPIILCIAAILTDVLTGQRGGKRVSYTVISTVALFLGIVPPLFLTGHFSLMRLALWLLATGYLCLRLMTAKGGVAGLPPIERAGALTQYAFFFNLACAGAIAIMLVLAIVLPNSVLYYQNLARYAVIALGILLCGPFGIMMVVGLALFSLMALEAYWLVLLGLGGLLTAAVVVFLATPITWGVRAVQAAVGPTGLSKKERICFTMFMLFPFLNTITLSMLRKRLGRL